MASVGLMLYRQAVAVLRDGKTRLTIDHLIREKFQALEAIYGRVVAERESA